MHFYASYRPNSFKNIPSWKIQNQIPNGHHLGLMTMCTGPGRIWRHIEIFYSKIHSLFSGRPYVSTLLFCSWCFFFSTRTLRAPSADHRETSPHDRNLCQFYKLTPKIRGALPPPLKKIGAKNMHNFGRFYTTSDFDREYLRNGSRYPKSEN